MGCGIKILSNNLLNETVFVSVNQGGNIFNLGEKIIPFMVYEIPGSNSISGTYNLYSPTYKKNYELVVPDLGNILPCVTPTVTPTISITPTLTPTISITPTLTITPTITITPTSPLLCNTLIDYNGPEVYPHISYVNIGYSTNTITTFEYSAYTVADRFILYYNNNILLDTGYVGSFVYDYGEMYRENFTEHLMGKIDPITNLEYPNISTTNSAPDGYPFVNSTSEGLFSFIKTSTSEIAKVEVYSCAPLNIWTFRLNCPIEPSITPTQSINPTPTPSIF